MTDCDPNKKNEEVGDLEGAEKLEGNGPLHKGGSDMDCGTGLCGTGMYQQG